MFGFVVSVSTSELTVDIIEESTGAVDVGGVDSAVGKVSVT